MYMVPFREVWRARVQEWEVGYLIRGRPLPSSKQFGFNWCDIMKLQNGVEKINIKGKSMRSKVGS